MTENQIRLTLEAARVAAQRQQIVMLAATDAEEAHQRLTATYGKERVCASRSPDSAALQAIIRHEERMEEAAKLLADFEAARENAENLINRSPSPADGDLLKLYYITGWPLAKIARPLQRSPRSIRRRIDRAVTAIARRCL